MKGKQNFIEIMFSGENGVISSKRVFGGIIILTVLISTIILVIKEGGSHTVNDILNTELFVGGTLLGLSSVTSIWKKPNIPQLHNESDKIITENKK